MSINKSKARKLAEFLRNLTDDAKLGTSAVEQDKLVTTKEALETNYNDTESLVTSAAVTSYVGDKLGDYVHGTHDINLTFTGDVTGHGTITDMSHTTFNLTLDAETLPAQTGYAGKFLTTDGTSASWAAVDTSNGDTAYGWGNHASAGYLTSINEGAGSGLDADLLDGQHGSYYAPASSIGNGTVTITTSGSASGGGTFTLNQSGNTTINISATDTNSTYNFSGSAFAAVSCCCRS